MQDGPAAHASSAGSGAVPGPGQFGRLGALLGHLAGLAVSVLFFLGMGGLRLLRSLVWDGRTTGQVMTDTEAGPRHAATRLAHHCTTSFIYEADGDVLTSSARHLSPCHPAQTPVEIAFNPSDPTQTVLVISGAREWFYLSLAIFLVLMSLYFTVMGQVRRRRNLERARVVFNATVDTEAYVRTAVARMDYDARMTTALTPAATSARGTTPP